MARTIVGLDCEVYPNYFLCVCKTTDGKVFKVERYQDEIVGSVGPLKAILRKHLIITFNGDGYDLPIVGAFLAGYTNTEIKALSDKIISGGAFWQISGQYPDIRIPKCEHIDLMGVTPLRASLKTYMCRIHAPTIQDLPIDPATVVDDEQVALLTRYCENDVDGTLLIFSDRREQIILRKKMDEYGDMRSKSDPQIAESVIRSHLISAGVPAARCEDEVAPFQYNMPAFIQFNSPVLRDAQQLVADLTFTVNSTGYIKEPEALREPVFFAGAYYQMGIGGLHSKEKKQVVMPNKEQVYGEFDVASMYPSIILGQGLYPQHIGPEFCDVYREIYDKRLSAKHSGDKVTADTLKIVLNASYGKFGSRYSFLYSPELLVQTTITGQLALLMLIERLVALGCMVMSANTDGVNVLMDKLNWQDALDATEQWTADTGLVLEWTPYLAQYSRDVNSYVCMTSSGGIKAKGAYELGGIHKGYEALVCVKAVRAYLQDGTPLKQSIIECNDVTDFLTMRGVRGGAVWRGEELGKVVRWYSSKTGEPIRYVTNGNKVAGSDLAVPMMTLTDELPPDLYYRWYLERSIKLLADVGVKHETCHKKVA